MAKDKVKEVPAYKQFNFICNKIYGQEGALYSCSIQSKHAFEKEFNLHE